MASSGIDELRTVDVWAVSMTFFAILNPDQSYPFQNDLKNIANKVTSNMKAASPQQLQKQAYTSFSLTYLLAQAMFSIENWLTTKIKYKRVRVSL